MTLSSYEFLGKQWYVASEAVKYYKLSTTNYNTYYAKYLCNGRLLGTTTSYEFRLSGDYLTQFKEQHKDVLSTSLVNATVVWLVDEDTLQKMLNREGEQGTVVTIESNSVSVNKHLHSAINNSNSNSNSNNDNNNNDIYSISADPTSYKLSSVSPTLYSVLYSEQQISDAIALLSCKLTNAPFLQEKILEGGNVRIDLLSYTRRSVYAIELKKNTISLDMVKEKIETKQYFKALLTAYPDLTISFVFTSPTGITLDALLYLQSVNRDAGPHKIIYRPVSAILYDMLNKVDKDLPPYFFKDIVSQDIVKYLLTLN
jgi:hypothetical protein